MIFLPSVRRCLLLLVCLICSYDDEDDTCSSYASPYRSLLSAASLAASVKVNSVVRPALNPALSGQLNISMLQIKFTNDLHAIGQGKPSAVRLCMLGRSDRNTQKDNKYSMLHFRQVAIVSPCVPTFRQMKHFNVFTYRMDKEIWLKYSYRRIAVLCSLINTLQEKKYGTPRNNTQNSTHVCAWQRRSPRYHNSEPTVFSEMNT